MGSEKSSPIYSDRLQRFVLQPVIFRSNAAHLAPSVYLSFLNGNPNVYLDAIRMRAGEVIGFNTYANSFYSSYWGKYADVNEVSLSGVIKGTGTIKLFRSEANGRLTVLGEYPIGIGPEEIDFHINFNLYESLASGFGAGRIFFDLIATSGAEISELAYCTYEAPKRTPKITVGVCTYKKEDYAKRLVLNFAKFVQQSPGYIEKIYIVNNDPDDKSVEANVKTHSPSGESMSVFTQPNIGGAGGFTRSLRESIKDDPDGYHVFMDDDAYIDMSVFKKLYSILAYSQNDCVYGGQMFNLIDPEYLYEGGAELDFWGFLSKVGENIKVSNASELCYYDQVRDVDYNAWWFACVPKKYASKIGLPMNIFIRGDDFEYGLRLGAAGVETCSFPGLFVWHEPFEGKTAAWLEYYNWRNRFVVCSVHGARKGISIQPVDMLRDILLDHLANRDLSLVFAICSAMLDFLTGPKQVLTSDAESLHTSIRSDLKLIENSSDFRQLADILDKRIEISGLKATGDSMITLALAPKLGGRERTEKNFWWYNSSLEKSVNAVLSIYAASGHQLAKQWEKDFSKYVSEEAWAKLYN